MNRRRDVLVLGLGNPLRGDDGVGPRVIAELEDHGLPEGIETLDAGTGGLDLLHVMEDHERIVIVDAAEIGKESGQFVRFTPDEVLLVESGGRFSLHHAGLAEILALTRALNRPLPPVVMFGVQPEDIGWGQGLSPKVEAGLPTLIDAVLAEITQ
ncbi:MAG: hydrogenase maturation protease [Anaerolineae bacterium]